MWQWGLCKPQITHFYGFSLLEANSSSESMVGRHLLNHSITHSRRTVVSDHAVVIEIFIKTKKKKTASPCLIFHLVSVCADYFIVENNSLLKATLRYKRIHITEYNTLQTDRFGKYLFTYAYFTASRQLSFL